MKARHALIAAMTLTLAVPAVALAASGLPTQAGARSSTIMGPARAGRATPPGPRPTSPAHQPTRTPVPSPPGTPTSGASTPAAVSGYLSTRGNQIVDSQGNAVRLVGAGLTGGEQDLGEPTAAEMSPQTLRAAKAVGFNTIRFTWCDEKLTPANLVKWDTIIAAGRALGLKFIMARMWQHPGQGNDVGNPLWYDVNGPIGRDQVTKDLVTVAEHYKGNDAVVGVELWNEVNNGTNSVAQASWGDGNQATDLRLAAETMGNAIHAVNPNLLIVVDGLIDWQDYKGVWGGHHLGLAAAKPVTLKRPNKVVYVFHHYPEFEDPASTQAQWMTMFGDPYNAGLPVMMGEGGLSSNRVNTPAATQWHAFMKFISGQTPGLKIPAGGRPMSWLGWSLVTKEHIGDDHLFDMMLSDWTTFNPAEAPLFTPYE